MPARLPLDAIGDIDLRLSTSRLIAGSAEIGRTGATVTLKNGEFVVNVGEAELERRAAPTRRLALAMDKEDLTAAAQLRLQDVSVAEMLGELLRIENLDGAGTVTIDAKARGRTWGEWSRRWRARQASPSLTACSKGVDLSGLPEAIKDPDGDAHGRIDEFTSASATLAFADGIVATEDLRAEGDAFTLRMTGRARSVRSVGRGPRDPDASRSRNGAGPTDMPFLISGTWNDWQRARRTSGLRSNGRCRRPNPSPHRRRTRATARSGSA